MNNKEREMMETLVSLLNDRGNQINADWARDTENWLHGLSDKAHAFDVAQEQASYALRYRHGEDCAALAKACKNIVALNA